MVKMNTLGKLLSAACLCAAFTLRASAPPDLGDVVTMGNDTFSITREAKNAFTRDVDKLKDQVSDSAAKFCAAQGKQLKVLSLTGNKPTFGTGYTSAKIIFQALNPGDPGLSSDSSAPAPVAVAARALTTDDLYGSLVKLDDLRKKGILTDDEFQAEKKKLLSHSK